MIQPLESRRLLAATAVLDGGIVKITGTPQPDHIGVQVAPGNATDFLVVTAEGSPILAVPLADVNAIAARLLEGNDSFRSGPDVFKPMNISGDGGDDVIATGSGKDLVVGGLGNDLFIAGRGADDYSGGPGIDTVSYADYTAAVRVTLDGLPNDGAQVPASTNAGGVSEGDNVRRDVEHVVGGKGDDMISVGAAPIASTDAAGPAGPIIFEGGPGNDTLIALRPTSTTPAVSIRTVTEQPLMEAPTDVNADAGVSGEVDTIAPEASFDSAAAFNAIIAVLRGGDGNDKLVGSPFNDLLDGGGGADTAIGNAGNDFFVFSPGPDDWSGGDGIDTADFSDAPAGVTVSLDGLPNDGLSALASPIAGSNVRPDIENVIGSRFNDFIAGSERRNRLDGGPGDDVIHGGAGDDTITGGPGNDRLFGDAGDDWFYARDGQHDVINGGDGADRAVADPLDELFDVELVAP